MLANGGWNLTLTLLTWTIWRAPTSASKWRMGFNSAFKELIYRKMHVACCSWLLFQNVLQSHLKLTYLCVVVLVIGASQPCCTCLQKYLYVAILRTCRLVAIYGTHELPQAEGQLKVDPYKEMAREGVPVCLRHEGCLILWSHCYSCSQGRQHRVPARVVNNFS